MIFALKLALVPLLIAFITLAGHRLGSHLDVAANDEIGLRMGAGVTLVVVLTALADGLGPRLRGHLTIFPVAVALVAQAVVLHQLRSTREPAGPRA